MARKRSATRPTHRVVRVGVPVTLALIPASALRGLPLEGSLADIINALIQRAVQRGYHLRARELRRK